MAIVGWYLKSKWIETFRPDGQGHITIADGINPPEDIAFAEIICDRCNADAGVSNEDGSEGSIYFNGVDSLCRDCGLMAESKKREGDDAQEAGK